LNSKYDPVRV